jgi:hypothetical protein
MIFALLLFALTACGAISPPAALMDGKMKVVEIGSGKPDTDNYVLHIPAGVQFPLRLFVHGSLLEKELDLTKKISIKRDIYLYRQWTSFDGKKWLKPEETDNLIEFRTDVNLDAEGGKITVFADEK